MWLEEKKKLTLFQRRTFGFFFLSLSLACGWHDISLPVSFSCVSSKEFSNINTRVVRIGQMFAILLGDWGVGKDVDERSIGHVVVPALYCTT
jgi:hypothetical protein